jgi:hypothetical protein
MSYKIFIKEFEKSLPSFMQKYARDISDEIIELMKFALEKDGLEIRGFFSMKIEKNNIRKTIKFKDLTKKS